VNGLTLEVVGWAAAFALTIAALFAGAAWVRSRNERRRNAARMREVLARFDGRPRPTLPDPRRRP
jgi:hypothetical protein